MAIKIKKNGQFRCFAGDTYSVAVHKDSLSYQYEAPDNVLKVSAVGTEISASQPLTEFTKENDSAFDDFDDFIDYVK